MSNVADWTKSLGRSLGSSNGGRLEARSLDDMMAADGKRGRFTNQRRPSTCCRPGEGGNARYVYSYRLLQLAAILSGCPT